MTQEELKIRIAQGESSTLQFKQQWSDNEKITKELVAFANSRGGSIVFGVEDKTGRIEGLKYDDVQAISSKVGNMAENNIIPALYIHSHPEEIDGKTVLVVDIPAGINKPYKTLKGCEIYVKQGADKRQVRDNRELLRMFYDSGQYYPDRIGVPDTSIANLSESLIDRFFLNQFNKRKEDFGVPVQNLYQNLCIIDEKGQATLAGLLFFGVMPTWKCPAFKIKAVCFVGNELSGTQYRDSVDLEGTIPEIYEQALRFCEGNLRHLQDGQSFNSEGHLEVSRIALEELIQNSLVHREMLGTDVVKLLIFDNRIVIESPGCLPGDLTVDKIKLGWAEMRNPLTAQLCAKTMPYRGLGSGITRALKSGERIDLVNDIERDKFVATIWRGSAETGLSSAENIDKSSEINHFSAEKARLVAIIGGIVGESAEKAVTIEKMAEILIYLETKHFAKTSDIATAIGRGESRTKDYLSKLQEMDMIVAEGNGKKRVYSVKN
ncbi:MAG: putative DNA binding domain-containing protein [Prevotellaceae bacterium]|nr:putative DNA binding domain-containing protein [Candidatus Colivivens equi]